MEDFELISSSEGLSEASNNDSGVSEIKGITKYHWLNTEQQQKCMMKTCKKAFSLLILKHHCRMCGKIFCSECLKFRKKLNFLAHPDPNGQLYKVCSICYEVGKDDTVTCRSRTELFKALKIEVIQEQIRYVDGNASLNKTRRQKLSLDRECNRLLSGFQNSFAKSEIKRGLHEMKTLLTTPEWQKSFVWLQESMTDKCQGCSLKFGLLTHKYTCKLCGQCLCKACSYKELLVYIPDNLCDGQNPTATLSIIRVIGSPEIEPEISLLLHVCGSCREYLIQRQTSVIEKEQQELEDQEKDVIAKLQKLDGSIGQLQAQVSSQLNQFQEVVESLEGSAQHSGPQSNIKLLAKAQTDIADNLASLSAKVPVIKAVIQTAETPCQKKICKYYLNAKCEFYLNNIFTFRQLKSKLYNSGPLSQDDLARIQGFVDQSAIVSVQVYIRQLVFETIAMCQKYKLHENIPTHLTTLDQVIEEEACLCLAAAGEDIQQHNKNLLDIIKAQMKERRLIRPSKRLLAVQKSTHAADIMLQRTIAVIDQVKVQLEVKTLKRSFKNTKSELDKVKSEVLRLDAKKLVEE